MSNSNKIRRYDFYVCGGMRGYPDLNYPLFNEVADLMIKQGLLPYNPAAYDGGISLGESEITFAFCMLRDLNAIINLCDGIALLPGWRKSLGANIEAFTAFACGKRIVEVTIVGNSESKPGKLLVLKDIDLSKYQLPYGVGATRQFDPHKCDLDKFE